MGWAGKNKLEISAFRITHPERPPEPFTSGFSAIGSNMHHALSFINTLNNDIPTGDVRINSNR
jgi:hypothetical protein